MARRKKKRTAAQRAATARMLAARRRSNPPKKKAKRRAAAPKLTARERGVACRTPRGNPPRRRSARRRGYKRNPPLLTLLQRGFMDGLYVTGGKVLATNANRVVSGLTAGLIPATTSPMIRTAIEVLQGGLVAIGIGMIGDRTRLVSADTTRMIVAGAFQAPTEQVIRALRVPILSTSLGEYDKIGMASYYRGSGVGRYAPGNLPATGTGRALPPAASAQAVAARGATRGNGGRATVGTYFRAGY